MQSIEIRRLALADARILDRVAPDVFDNAINAEFLNAFLTCPRHQLFVAVHDDLVVGMCSGVEYFHPDKAPQLWINEIGVAPAYRRRGIGRRLLDSMIDLGYELHHTWAWLHTASDNAPAHALFDRASDSDDNPKSYLLYEWDLAEQDPEPGPENPDEF